MPNGKTQNYQLSQWEKTDQVRMEDFNADNRNIENALTGLETSKAEVTAVEELKSEVAQKAEQTALTALESQVNGLSTGKADAAKLTALESQVNGLSTGKADAAKLTALESQVNGLSTSKADAAKLTALESQVNGLSTSKADASALTAEVNARTTADQSLTAALEKKADASALTALQSQVTGLSTSKADASALTALSTRTTALESGKVEIITGTYTGNGTAERTIALGRKPKAVFVATASGETHRDGFVFGGLALPNMPVKQDDAPGLTLTDTGFIVYYRYTASSRASITNSSSTVFHYLAFV